MAITVYNWTKDSGNVSASFDTWVGAQGSTPRSLAIGADITITGNLTIPSTIDITTITNNAKFTGSGKTLTINRMTATPRHQIFDTGLHVLFASGATTYILPEWFGSGNGNVCFGSGINTPRTKVYVEGGVAIGTNLNAGSGNLYVAGSGTFAGVVHGVAPVGNTDLTTKLYVDTASGALDTRINNSGGYTANVSGQLDTRISATGLYAANVSGQLNTYITNTSGQLNTKINNISGVLIGRTITTATTLLSTEAVLRCSGAFTVTLYQSTGSQRVHYIKNIGAGLVTVSGNGTQTIDGSRTIEMYPGTIGAYPSMTIYDGISGNWDIL